MTTLQQDLTDPGEPCPWLIEVPSGNPEPDSPSDTIKHVACGALLRPDGPDGSVCEAGHQFGNLERRLGPFGDEWEREQTERDEAGYGFSF
jgi:hypothetical protein